MNNLDISGTRPDRDLQALSEYLEEAGSYHQDFVRRVAKYQPGPPLFHYTGLSGLQGLVSKHDLWLTHALYCNDEAEVTLGINVARDQIQSLVEVPGVEPPRRDYLSALDALLVQPPRESVYICCFCEHDDVLNQWRGYGGNGNGVSIQIDPNKFVDYTGNQPFGFLSIWNVRYEKPRQEQIMKRAIERTYEKFSASLPPDQIAKKAKDVIDFFVPTFKHDGFQEECEWRMILAPSPSSKVKPLYRAARDMLIPYYSLKELVLSTARKKYVAGLT